MQNVHYITVCIDDGLFTELTLTRRHVDFTTKLVRIQYGLVGLSSCVFNCYFASIFYIVI